MFSVFNRKMPQLMKAATTFVGTKVRTEVKTISLSATSCTPKIRQPAPNFSGSAVVNSAIQKIQLADYKGKYVVLVFYPLDFTFVCPTELIALDERINDFKKLNAEVIGCSIDSPYTHLGWMNTERSKGGLGKLHYPLLSDMKREIARDYGVLLEEEQIALRGLFIIDPKGILRQMTINDLDIGRSVDEALRLVEALRFTEEHGEVCPANWKKGEKTIKPDPEGALEYFSSTEKRE